MTEYRKLWKKNGTKWVLAGQDIANNSLMVVTSAGTYKVNICVNGFWGEPEIIEITEDMLQKGNGTWLV